MSSFLTLTRKQNNSWDELIGVDLSSQLQLLNILVTISVGLSSKSWTDTVASTTRMLRHSSFPASIRKLGTVGSR